MNFLSSNTNGPNWSKLPSDLLHMVFERLGFKDFQRAKSVCSFWRYVSKHSSRDNQISWVIMFTKNKDYCHLLNPEENEKMYKISDLGVNFANSNCLTTYGSWLLLQDPTYNLYLMNLFTRERINLPSNESQLGMCMTTFRTELVDKNVVHHREPPEIGCSLLWVDEKTKNYLVVWGVEYNRVLFYSKEGDMFWKEIKFGSILKMVYKDNKLYVYDIFCNVKIMDFSGDMPRPIFESHVYSFLEDFLFPREQQSYKKDNLIVTLAGEVLRVKSMVWIDSNHWSFDIYTMVSSEGCTYWKKLTSLGDEVILLDMGITVFANDIKGVKGNSIYFSGYQIHCSYAWSVRDIFIFNLDTQEVERPHQSILSSIQSSDARWFIPVGDGIHPIQQPDLEPGYRPSYIEDPYAKQPLIVYDNL